MTAARELAKAVKAIRPDTLPSVPFTPTGGTETTVQVILDKADTAIQPYETYSTVNGLSSLLVPNWASSISTTGFDSPGDGGAWLNAIQVSNSGDLKPWQRFSNFGEKRWELSEAKVRPEMFGVFPDGNDHSGEMQEIFDYFSGRNANIEFEKEGEYRLRNLVWSGEGRRFKMKGHKAVKLMTGDNTSDMFSIIGHADIEGFTVYHPELYASTSGRFFTFTKGQHNIRDLVFYNGYDWIKYGDGSIHSGIKDIHGYTPKHDAIEIDVSPLGDAQTYGIIELQNIKIQAISGNTGCGVRMISGDTIYGSDSNVAGFQCNMSARPNNGRSYLANLHFTNWFADGAGGSTTEGLPGWYFDGSEKAIYRVNLVNCWSSFIPHMGVLAKKVKGLTLSDCNVLANLLDGIFLEACRDVLIDGNLVSGNSRSPNENGSSGITLLTGNKHIRIKSNRSGPAYNGTDDTQHFDSQKYGLFIADDTTEILIVEGNDLTGNLSGSFSDPAGGVTNATRIWSNNQIGAAVSF